MKRGREEERKRGKEEREISAIARLETEQPITMYYS